VNLDAHRNAEVVIFLRLPVEDQAEDDPRVLQAEDGEVSESHGEEVILKASNEPGMCQVAGGHQDYEDALIKGNLAIAVPCFDCRQIDLDQEVALQ